MNNNKEYQVLRSQTVEIQINSTSSARFHFPDSSTLRKRKIVGAAIRPQNAAETRLSKNNRPLVGEAALACAFLSLNYNGVLVLDTLPLELLAPEFIQEPFFQLCIPEGYDPQESYIEFVDLSTLAIGQSVEVTFYYYDDYCNDPRNC